MLADLVETLRPLAPIVVPLFWVTFFGFALVAIYHHRHQRLRRAFIASFFVGLVFFATISPVVLLPYVQWHKFSTPYPTEVEHLQMRVVDEHGDELMLDNRATLAFEGVRMSGLNNRMVEEYDEATNERVARHLLEQAETYRSSLRSPSPLRYVRFPHHGITSTWTADELETYGAFVGIRIYRLTIVTSDDGKEVLEIEETLLFEAFPDTHAPREADQVAVDSGIEHPDFVEGHTSVISCSCS